MDENSIPDHKLCGFLCTVLKIPPPHPADLAKTLTPHTPCQLFAGDSEIGFVSQNSIVFSVINPNAGAVVAAECSSRPSLSSSSCSSVMKKWRRIGLVHGSMSVVHQLHALVNHKCLEIRARVINFEVDEQNCGEIRVVVLVDVYLPIGLWSGWQFPRMGSTAAALFRHLRCIVLFFDLFLENVFIGFPYSWRLRLILKYFDIENIMKFFATPPCLIDSNYSSYILISKKNNLGTCFLLICCTLKS